MSRHPSDDDLERFLAARLTLTEQQRVVRHLLAGCGACSRKLVGQAPERLLESASDTKRESKIRNSIRDRTLAEALKQDAHWRLDDKKLARSLELLRQSPDAYDRLSLQQVRSLQGPSFVEALLVRIAELRLQDPKALRWLAYNAVKAAEGLETEGNTSLLAFDLQAQAWAELANAYRINEEFDEAAGAFDQARKRLRRGSGSLGILARVADMEATLLRAQRRMAEASELTDGSYKAYVALGDSHLQGRILISKAANLRYQGHSSKAIAVFRKGLALIEEEREPQIVPIAQQSFIDNLISGGMYQEAAQLLLKSGLRQSLAGFPIALLRLRWTEGQLLAHHGKGPGSERAFLETRNAFLEMRLDYDAALVGLDLLSIWNHQGKSTKVRELAREVYGVLRDLGIRPEAAKAERYLH
jgi:tetratricopeptide (TPR) repeat protein